MVTYFCTAYDLLRTISPLVDVKFELIAFKSSQWHTLDGTLPMNDPLYCNVISFYQSCVAQLVMCLATDVSLTEDPGVASLIPAWSYTFMVIIK